MYLIDAANEYVNFKDDAKKKKDLKESLYNWDEISSHNKPVRNWSLASVSSSVAASSDVGAKAWVPTIDQFRHAAELIRKLREDGDFNYVAPDTIKAVIKVLENDISRARQSASAKHRQAVTVFDNNHDQTGIPAFNRTRNARRDIAEWKDFRTEFARLTLTNEIGELKRL